MKTSLDANIQTQTEEWRLLCDSLSEYALSFNLGNGSKHPSFKSTFSPKTRTGFAEYSISLTRADLEERLRRSFNPVEVQREGNSLCLVIKSFQQGDPEKILAQDTSVQGLLDALEKSEGTSYGTVFYMIPEVANKLKF